MLTLQLQHINTAHIMKIDQSRIENYISMTITMARGLNEHGTKRLGTKRRGDETVGDETARGRNDYKTTHCIIVKYKHHNHTTMQFIHVYTIIKLFMILCTRQFALIIVISPDQTVCCSQCI